MSAGFYNAEKDYRRRLTLPGFRCRFLISILVALTMLALLAGCSFPTVADDPEEDEPPTSSRSWPVLERGAGVSAESMSISVVERRRRLLADGYVESRRGPVEEVQLTDTAYVGHGDVVVEFAFPIGIEKETFHAALQLEPEGAEVQWTTASSRSEVRVQVQWPGSIYEGIRPQESEQLPAQYQVQLPAGSRLGENLVLQQEVRIKIKRTDEPLYTIEEVDNEAVRTPYYRPRRGYDLARQQHVFELQFTKPMDMDSVGSTLEEQLGCTGLTEFDAVDERTARYMVMTEPQKSCTINPEGAEDQKGNVVWFGAPLRFSVLPPADIMWTTLQLGTGERSEPEFLTRIDPGRAVELVLSQTTVVALEAGYDGEVGGCVSYLPWVYMLDPETGEVTESRDLATRVGFVHKPVLSAGSDHLLFRQPGLIVSYDVSEDSLQTVFEVSADHRIYGFGVSPDGARLAVLFSPVTAAADRSLQLAVVDLERPQEKRRLFEEVGNLSPEAWVYGERIDVAWIDRTDELVFATHMKQRWYPAVLDLDTGDVRLLMEGPDLRRAPLFYRVGTREVFGLTSGGVPVLFNTMTGEVTFSLERDWDYAEEVTNLAVREEAAALQVGSRTIVVSFSGKELQEIPGQLIDWAEESGALLFYRWE